MAEGDTEKMVELELIFKIKDEEILFMGSLAEIKNEAANRLGCKVDDIIYKIEINDNRLIEVVASHESWTRLAQKGKTIHCSVKSSQEQQKKRKSVSQDESDPPEQVASTSKTTLPTPRSPPPKKSRSTSLERLLASRIINEKSRPLPGPRASTSSVPSRKTTQQQPLPRPRIAPLNGYHWSPKDDLRFWTEFISAVERLPSNTIYSVKLRKIIMEKISKDAFQGTRSVSALDRRMWDRITTATENTSPLPQQMKMLYPKIFERVEAGQKSTPSNKATKTIVDDDSSDELSSPDSTESEATPPAPAPPTPSASVVRRSKPPALQQSPSYN